MKCRTKFCRGRAWKSGRSPYCAKCKARLWRDRHPASYAFSKLKYRAAERGIAFELTREEWLEFWTRENLAERRGKTANSITVDRINPKIGYRADNIRSVTLSYNCRQRYAPLPDWMKAEMEEAIATSSPL